MIVVLIKLLLYYYYYYNGSREPRGLIGAMGHMKIKLAFAFTPDFEAFTCARMNKT
jgi:hypothetical protein